MPAARNPLADVFAAIDAQANGPIFQGPPRPLVPVIEAPVSSAENQLLTGAGVFPDADLERARQLASIGAKANDAPSGWTGNFGTQGPITGPSGAFTILEVKREDSTAKTLTVVLAPIVDNSPAAIGGLHPLVDVFFGQGGVQSQATLDYPLGGAAFQVHASWLRVVARVVDDNNPPPPGFANVLLNVGGWATEGEDPRGSCSEPHRSIFFAPPALAAAGTVSLPIPAFASDFRLTWSPNTSEPLLVQQEDRSGQLLGEALLADSSGIGVIPIIGSAYQLKLTNNSAAAITHGFILFGIEL